MVEIIRADPTEGDSPVCSRCGMAYGLWELKLAWADGKPAEYRRFNHLVGCRWTVGGYGKDFGPQLRKAELIPNNANIIRMS